MNLFTQHLDDKLVQAANKIILQQAEASIRLNPVSLSEVRAGDVVQWYDSPASFRDRPNAVRKTVFCEGGNMYVNLDNSLSPCNLSSIASRLYRVMI